MIRHLTLLALILICAVRPVQAKPSLQDIDKLIQAGQDQTALSELDNLLAEDKNNPRLLFSRARLLAATGQLDKAVEQYQALIRLQPTLPEPYNNLAVIYQQQGKPEQARDLLNQAMMTHPGYARVYKNLTAVNAAQARDAYAKALQMPANHQLQGLEIADNLTLPEKQAPSIPAAPVVTAATKPAVKPAMIYQAPDPTADKNTATVTDKRRVTGTEAETESVQGFLREWAGAWSAKNVDQYLHFYSDDYSPGGLSHQRWVAERRDRINRPKWIRVSVRNIQVSDAGQGRVSVRLEQEYAADNYSDVTRKEFVLQRMAGQWRIINERGLGYITR